MKSMLQKVFFIVADWVRIYGDNINCEDVKAQRIKLNIDMLYKSAPIAIGANEAEQDFYCL